MTSPVPSDHGPTLELGASEALLRRLELTVRNRLDGLLQGNYIGLIPGPGTEAGESRQYVPGDDVRRMDWPVTARTTIPHVRRTIADRELETWLVVDLSPSMDFGTGLTEKRELVLAAITAVVHLTVRGGNRVGAVVSNGREMYRVPALGGRNHARYLIRRIAATRRVESSGGPDLVTMLESLRRPPRRRGMVAVVSDFLDTTPDPGTALRWERPLRALSERHQLVGIEVLDPRELELPAAGLVTFVDPETGRELEVQTNSASVRQNYADAARAQRDRIAIALRHAGAGQLQLRTDRDWLNDVVRFVIARRKFAGPTNAQSAQGLR
ncbi:MAG TPA: DUF58 domain-containing protein [Jatrophihabitantaceae bacterium]|nr:DUF58 domain-containing protein [Jatrophihabitantaceae bacterium]